MQNMIVRKNVNNAKTAIVQQRKFVMKFLKKSSGPFNYPDTIKVKMSDGKVVCYSRR